MSKYTLHSSIIKNIDTLKHEGLKEAVKDFINYTPIDFVVLENGAFRTAEQQKELYDLGYSQLDGYKYKSKHQSGYAVDLVPWVNGRPTWDREYLLRLSGAFYTYLRLKGIEFICGADWNDDGNLSNDSWDCPHFEIKE